MHEIGREKSRCFLSWEPSNESDIAGYNIYRNLNSTFLADSTNLIGFTDKIEYSDTNNIQFYKMYFYKVRAVDKGGLLSDESSLSAIKFLKWPLKFFHQMIHS